MAPNKGAAKAPGLALATAAAAAAAASTSGAPRVINLSGVKRTSLSGKPSAALPVTNPAPAAATTGVASESAPSTVKVIKKVGPGLAALALKQVCDLRHLKAPAVVAKPKVVAVAPAPVVPKKKRQKKKRGQQQDDYEEEDGEGEGDLEEWGDEYVEDEYDVVEEEEEEEEAEKIRIKPNAAALKWVLNGVEGHNKRILANPSGAGKVQLDQQRTEEALERLGEMYPGLSSLKVNSHAHMPTVKLNGAKEILRISRHYGIGITFHDPELRADAARALDSVDEGTDTGSLGSLVSDGLARGKMLGASQGAGAGTTTNAQPTASMNVAAKKRRASMPVLHGAGAGKLFGSALGQVKPLGGAKAVVKKGEGAGVQPAPAVQEEVVNEGEESVVLETAAEEETLPVDAAMGDVEEPTEEVEVEVEELEQHQENGEEEEEQADGAVAVTGQVAKGRKRKRGRKGVQAHVQGKKGGNAQQQPPVKKGKGGGGAGRGFQQALLGLGLGTKGPGNPLKKRKGTH